jgi:cysteinyl-tRNA synthetase
LFDRLNELSSSTGIDGDKDFDTLLNDFEGKFEQAMDDDFNTPKALAVFHELRGEINKLFEKGLSNQAGTKAIADLRKYGKPLGLLQIPPENWRFGYTQVIRPDSIPLGVTFGTPQVIQKIELRNEARAKKDFATADKIRKELVEQGIILEDRPDGTTRWKR